MKPQRPSSQAFKMSGRQRPPTEPHEVRTDPSRTPAWTPPPGHPPARGPDRTRRMFRSSGRPPGFNLRKLQEKLDCQETCDRTRPPPVPSHRPRPPSCLGWCFASAGARSVPARQPSSLRLEDADVPYKLSRCDHPIRHHPGGLAPRSRFYQETWIRQQRPCCPLSSSLLGLKQQHCRPLQHPLGRLRHSRSRRDRKFRRSIQDAALLPDGATQSDLSNLKRRTRTHTLDSLMERATQGDRQLTSH